MGAEVILLSAAVATALAGAATSAVGSIQQGNAAESAARQQSENEKYQALLNDQRAGFAQIQGEEESRRRALQIALDRGANRSAFAGNGLLIENGGTVAAVDDATVREGWQDIATIKQNAAMTVWGFQSNAAANRASASSLLATGKAQKRAGQIGAAGSALSGVGSALSAGAAGYDLGSRLSSAPTIPPNGMGI